jgi:hypothetical protein
MLRNETYIAFANRHWVQCRSHTRLRLIGDRLQLECDSCCQKIETPAASPIELGEVALALAENSCLRTATATVQ